MTYNIKKEYSGFEVSITSKLLCLHRPIPLQESAIVLSLLRYVRMQVVYSGGSTPSPSPHLQRKAGYGRPSMQRYITHVHPQIFVQRSREKFTEGDMTLRDSIPSMSKCTAVICLLLNIILPGFGTLVAGLSVLCCSQVRPKGDSKGHCIWMNAGVGLLQFLLTFLFLLGWIWSIMWGVAFLTVSKNFPNRTQQENSRIKPQYIQNAHSVPHKASQLRKVGSCRNNRTTQENVKNCNVHDHSHDSCTLGQSEHHSQHHRKQTLKDVAPEAFICNVAASAETNACSFNSHQKTHRAVTSCKSSPKDCTVFESVPETAYQQQSTILQSRQEGDKSDTCNTQSCPIGDKTPEDTRLCRETLLPKITAETDICSFPVTDQQTAVLYSHKVQTPSLDVCPEVDNRYKNALTKFLSANN